MKFKPSKKNRMNIHILCTYICRIKLLRLSMFSIQLLKYFSSFAAVKIGKKKCAPSFVSSER